MADLLDELIRERENLKIRGLPLKTTVSDVVALEGEPTERRDPSPDGTRGFLRYTREIGEFEDLEITYPIERGGQIDELQVVLTSWPFLYWKKNGGREDEAWFEAHEGAALSPLAPLWTETREALVKHLAALLGALPKPTKPSWGFKKKKHEGQVWTWSTPDAHVTLMSYVDDLQARDAGDIKLFLKLTIVPPTEA